MKPREYAGVSVAVLSICMTTLVIGPMLFAGDEPQAARVFAPLGRDASQAPPADINTAQDNSAADDAERPKPQVQSNCVKCHLTAGRELTDAVHDFAHSIHDLNALSCSDCHGGNTEDDVAAHDEQFDFIGTKLSAHIEKCGDCHDSEVELLAKSAHHWDFSKKINLDYPTCIDCHGNHDIGNPPEDFRLREMCGDCHEDDEAAAVDALAVAEANDRLWAQLLKARASAGDDALPENLQTQIDAIRETTMQYMHDVGNTDGAEAEKVRGKTRRLGEALRAWLESNG